MTTPPERTNPSKPEKASKRVKGPSYTPPKRTTRIRRAIKGLPKPLQAVLNVLAVLIYIGGFYLGLQLVINVLIVMLDVPWVASVILLGIFVLFLLPSNGWTEFGTYLFLFGPVVSAFLDIGGNPILNAPFEKLFLNEGEYLAGRAVVENPSAAEIAISGDNYIVDADGNELRDISDFHTFLYRLAVYSVIYAVFITLRGFFPNMKTESKNDSNNKNKAKRKRKQSPRTV